MYTRCPKCSTCFRVTDRHLTIANGKVRCGQCQHVFHAPTHAVDDLPVMKNSDENKPAREVPVQQQKASQKTIAKRPELDTPVINKSTQLNQDNDEHLFNDEIDLNKAIDELSRSADDDLNLGQKKIKQAAAKQHQENLAENIFSTDNYDATNASSVEDVINELENQLSEDVNPAEATHPDKEIDFINLDSEINNFETVALENTEFPENDEATDTIEKDIASITSELNIKSINEGLAEDDFTDTGTDNPNSVLHSPDNIDIPFRLRNDIERLQAPIKRRWHPLIYFLLILFMLQISAAQLIYFRAHEIVSYIPEAQPYLEKICKELICSYSGPRDLDKIQLISRDVRVHPQHKNALLISAAMINGAEFAQPYPKVHIRLSDISGNIVAERTFNSKTYLGDLDNPFLLMKSQTPVLLTFEVVDPGKDAINFEFTFH